MSFRTSKLVLRQATGGYVDGVWIGGSRSVLTTVASCQPASTKQDLLALPEGRQHSDLIKIYSDDRLQIAEEGLGLQPDCVVFDGVAFEIVSYFAHQSGVINHYKYMAVKSFRFTNEADWLAGAIGGPL